MNGDLVDLFPDRVGKKLGIYAVYPFTRQPPQDKVAYRTYPPALPRHRPLLRAEQARGNAWSQVARLCPRLAERNARDWRLKSSGCSIVADVAALR